MSDRSGNADDQATWAEGSKFGARLVAQQGPERGRSFTVPATGLLVGRAPECSLAINDVQISRRHARFYWHGPQLMVEDLGSINGTLVNGRPVAGPQRLFENDTIEIGGSAFIVQGLLSRELTPTVRSLDTAVAAKPPAAPRPRPAPAGGNKVWPLALVGFGLAILLGVGALAALLYYSQTPDVTATRPTAAFITPLNGVQVAVGQPVIVQATGAHSRGVTRLELWVDGNLIGQQKSINPAGDSPLLLSLTWTPPVPGRQALEVRAFNAANQQNTPVIITVEAVSGSVAATSTVTASATATLESLPSPTALPTTTSPSIIIFTPTPSATPLPSPSATAQPGLQAISDVNVRGGPGTLYPTIGLLRANDSVAVVGRSPDGAWWQIVFPPNTGGVGWVVGTYVQPNQAANNVPVVGAPPLPATNTPVPTDTPVPPTATNTSVPATVTNTPIPTELSFSADDTDLNQGECTRLRWRVRNVAAYWVDGVPGVGDEGQKEVCDPVGTTTHTLRIKKRDDSTQDFTVTITVRAGSVPQPILISPEPNKEFNYFPREVTFVWGAVAAPGTVTYNIEIEYNGGSWTNWRTVNGLASTTYTMDNFAGAIPGRWRVWATSSALGAGPKTEWREFKFLQ